MSPMLLEGGCPDLEARSASPIPARKELKVQVDASLHLRLHVHKAMTGTLISEAVHEALHRYFDAERVEAHPHAAGMVA